MVPEGTVVVSISIISTGSYILMFGQLEIFGNNRVMALLEGLSLRHGFVVSKAYAIASSLYLLVVKKGVSSLILPQSHIC